MVIYRAATWCSALFDAQRLTAVILLRKRVEPELNLGFLFSDPAPSNFSEVIYVRIPGWSQLERMQLEGPFPTTVEL